MTRPLTALAVLTALAAPLPALAENPGGGDSGPAGGAFNSSYVKDPYAVRGPAAFFTHPQQFGPDVTSTATVPQPARPARPARARGRR